MKRKGNIFNEVTQVDNIALACLKAFKGKNNTVEIFEYKLRLTEIIQEIRDMLLQGNFDFGGYRKFTIYEPKERLISAPNLRQRIVHHALMNVCHDCFERKYIFHSYASRPGKGAHAAVKSVYQASKKYEYCLKLDVRKFFDSIDHGILKQMLSKIFKDDQLLSLFYNIIDSYETTVDKGLPIGNLTSQYFANMYLTDLDHYMLEKVKVDFYCRYMDDVIILSDSSVNLKRYYKCFMSFCSTCLNLKIKPPIFGNMDSGIVFLGYRISSKGIQLSGKSKRRYRRKSYLYEKLFSEGILNEYDYGNRIRALVAFTEHANARNFRRYCLVN